MGRYTAKENVPYFCTITILDWIPVLIDQRFIDPIIECLQYSRQQKGLQIFAYIIMPNHMHCIIGIPENLHEVIRDFKRFTSRTIRDKLKESGRSTILRWLEQATEPSRRARGEFGLWQPGFHPLAIHNQKFFDQKIRYIHENPLRKGLVDNPVDWRYSSARQYAGFKDFNLEMDSLVW